MNKHNTILGQMLELVPRSRFEKLVKEHETEYCAKSLKSWTHFVAMLLGQISGQHGLRSIERAMNSQRNSWYHLGINNTEHEIKRSTISYANTYRSADLFKSLFENMVTEAQKHPESHGMKFKKDLYSIDTTTIDLCLELFPWADFRTNKGGIKLTVKLDHRGKIPSFVSIGNARENDSKKIWAVPFEKGDVLTFDRGFNDYEYFASICKKKAWFVTRLKSNAVYTVVRNRPVKKGGNIVSDEEIILSSMKERIILRKIISIDPETNKEITLLTNHLMWSSVTISAVYKQRWQIELFFKAIKHNLKIKRFYGNSKNAVMTQIWIALIAYLLFYILKKKCKNPELSLTTTISFIKTMLFQRVSLYEILCAALPPKPRPQRVLQYAFQF